MEQIIHQSLPPLVAAAATTITDSFTGIFGGDDEAYKISMMVLNLVSFVIAATMSFLPTTVEIPGVTVNVTKIID